MIKGQKLKTYEGIQVTLLPTAFWKETQGMNVGSHIGTCAVDSCAGWHKPLYAPVDIKVVATETTWSRPTTYQSVEKVLFADGTVDYLTFVRKHEEDSKWNVVGKVYLQGAMFGYEGGYGVKDGVQSADAYPDHLHFESGKGKLTFDFKNNKLPGSCDPSLLYFNNGTTLNKETTLHFKPYTGKTWEDKLADDAAAEAARLEAERIAAEKAAAEEARIIAEQEAMMAQAAKEAAELQALKDKNFYITQPGDTLQSIAIKKGVTWKNLYEANKQILGNNPLVLPVGIKLMIPFGSLAQVITGTRIGDEVYWEGFLYRDSFGTGRTKTYYPKTKGVVDIINKHLFPVHIKGKGWVSIAQIKKV